MLASVLMTLLMLVGFLLMFIILLQRGRGGGLAGAFGGAGGQSALGTRAGDVFTRITIVLAVVWVLLAAGSGFALRDASRKYPGGDKVIPEKPEVSSDDKTGTENTDGDKKPGLDLPATNPFEKPDTSATDKKPESDANKDEPGKDEPKPDAEKTPASEADKKPESETKPEDK